MLDTRGLKGCIGHLFHLVADDQRIDGAIYEGILVYHLDVAADCHFGEMTTVIECLFKNACHRIIFSLVGDGIGDVECYFLRSFRIIFHDIGIAICVQTISDVVNFYYFHDLVGAEADEGFSRRTEHW